MDNPALVIISVVFAAIGIAALIRPTFFRWTPLYRTYAAALGEQHGLMVTRLSIGLGGLAVPVVFALLDAGVIG